MKQFILKHKKAITGTLALMLIGFSTMSFPDSPIGYSKFTGEDDMTGSGYCTDTLPEKEGIKMKDFDKVQDELDKVLGKVGAELKGLDFEKLQVDAAQKALREIDMENIMKSVEQSLKSIDLDKAMAEASASIKDIKIGYSKEEMEKALADASKEIEKAKKQIKETDKEAIKKELEEAKKEIEKRKFEIEKIDLNKVMDEAREGVNKAKEELKLTKEMFTEMEKDGLVDSKAGFTIEYKNKELYIDGKRQDEKTTGKYRKYFKKDDFKIKIEKE
ncbi:MAG: hypothetical protein JNM14_10990 [Ferruginibacter sp.]|nr:hypothetical protein [Ferruginibacter sp.]